MRKSPNSYQKLLFLSLLGWPLMLILASLCTIYHFFICTYLKMKYKDKFGGMVESADAVWTIEDNKVKTTCGITLILETPVKNPGDFKRSIKNFIHNNVFKNPDVFPKLTCIRSTFMGYSFYIKNEYTADECVNSLEFETDKEEIDKNMLMQAIGYHCNLPLPKDHKALWEILVSSKPIKWHSTRENMYHYPVFFKISHVLGDGISLFTLFKQNFSVAYYQNRNSNDTSYKFDLLKFFSDTVKYLPIILIAPAVSIFEGFLMKTVNNALSRKQLSGEKFFVSNLETGKKLVPMIKKIKDTVPEVSFSDIISAAISDSLAQYFKKKSFEVPKELVACHSVLMGPLNFDTYTSFVNNFSAGFLNLPVLVEPESDMLKRLTEVAKQGKLMRESYLLQVMYWLLTRICAIMPKFLLNFFLKSDAIFMFLSNMPGVQTKMYLFDGYEVKDVVPCMPNRGTIGTGICVMTHAGRLQVSLYADKAVFPTEEDAQFVVDRIVHSIISIYESIK